MCVSAWQRKRAKMRRSLWRVCPTTTRRLSPMSRGIELRPWRPAPRRVIGAVCRHAMPSRRTDRRPARRPHARSTAVTHDLCPRSIAFLRTAARGALSDTQVESGEDVAPERGCLRARHSQSSQAHGVLSDATTMGRRRAFAACPMAAVAPNCRAAERIPKSGRDPSPSLVCHCETTDRHQII